MYQYIKAITIGLLLTACGSDTTIKDEVSTDPPQQEICDYEEWDIGTTEELSLAQFVTSLPVFTEYKLCGDISNEIEGSTLILDYDSYLYPVVGLTGNTELLNFSLNIDLTHTPLVEVFIVFDGAEPVQVGYFIGASGVIQVIDWPVLLQGTYQNDVILRVSAFSFATSLESEYKLRFW